MQLIGREKTWSELDAAYARGERLISLTGPGGIGKTAVARAYAARTNGLVVDMTEAVTFEGVASKLALALEVPLSGGDHAGAIARALDEDALLVLDNCEQALSALDELTGALCSARPDVRVLVTSQEPLGARGEAVLRLPLLDDEDALALFEARGREARPDFAIGERGALVTEVVRRLDRLPLAIELAAARLEVMTLEQLAGRLEDQLRLLRRVGGTEDRHATLRATIAWSWALLDDDARRTLMQCAIFRDGFTLEAVEAVVDTEGWADDALQDLKRKSLVLAEPGEAGLRFRLLESVRAFAAEQLRGSGEEAGARERFVAFFAPAVDEPRAWKKLDAEGCAHLRAEVENLLEAHNTGDPRSKARAALALDRFFASEGPVDKHLRTLDAGVAAAEADGEPTLLARMLIARGEAHRRRAHPAKAKDDFERAEALAKDTPALAAEVDLRFALLHMVTGDLEASLARAALVVDAARDVDARTTGLAHGLFGSLKLYFGEGEEGARALERALPYLREAADDRSLGLTLANLGVIHMDRGEHERGQARLDEAAALFTAIRDGFNLATVQINRALASLDQGEAEAAVPLLEETHALCKRVGHLRLAAYNEMCLGIAAHQLGDLDRARERLAWAIERAENAKEQATIGAAHAHLALVLAKLGEDPEPSLARADEVAAAFPAPWVRRVAQVCRALVDGRGTDEIEDAPTQVRIAKRLRAEPTRNAPGQVMAIGPDARWIQLPEMERQDLSRRGPLRRILMALADAQRGDALDVNQLIEAGWPGEKMHPESGAARVYAAIRTLRKLGLEAWLLTRDDGYLLDPELTVKRE